MIMYQKKLGGTRLTLAAVLREFFEVNSKSYEPLFTTGYLSCEQGQWKVSRKKPDDLPKYYSDLAAKIANETEVAEMPEPEAFASRFNREWTSRCFSPSRKAYGDQEDDILFKSKSDDYKCFSNFFPTLIFLRMKGDENLSFLTKFYFCLEIPYMARQAASLDLAKAKELSVFTDPGKVKTAMQKLREEHGKEIRDEEKLALMRQLLQKKFTQNPVLADYLKNTKKRQLVEDTSSSFWGRGDEGTGENWLGKLLMQQRATLS